jgi:hypothetical protein
VAGACSATAFAAPTSAQVPCALLDSAARTVVDPARFTPGSAAPPRVLPLNIDVAALAAALASTDPGELGAQLAGRPFNGIVYVTSTWSTALGPSISSPPLGRPPLQNLPAVVSGVRPLCTTACSTSAAPDVVRIVNAASLAGFPRGLSIVTNLPVQIVGAANIDAAAPGSFLIGGDTVTLLSSAYTDQQAVTAPASRPVALATQYRVAAIAGQTLSTAGQGSHGIDGFFRVGEAWPTPPVVVGAVVVGFSPVYSQHPWPPPAGSPAADLRQTIEFSRDPDLRLAGRAPPGVPVTQQVQTRSWEQ